MEQTTHFKLWATQLDASGNVHVPIELRKAMNAKAGSPIVWVRTDVGIMLRPYEQVIAEVRDHYYGIEETSCAA